MKKKLKMFEKVCLEGPPDKTGIFVQLGETMTNAYYDGFPGCQRLLLLLHKHQSVVHVVHSRTYCKHLRSPKKEQDSKKHGVRPEGKSYCGCRTITLF